MQRLKRWLMGLGGGVLGLGILTLILSITIVDFLVDVWWFNSLGYEFYFWQRLLYRYVIFASVSLLFFLIFFLNFWVASRYLGTTAPPADKAKPGALGVYKDLFKMFRRGSMWVYTPLSLILAIPIALPVFHEWESFLFYVFGPSSPVKDPTFGKSISYYLFSLPIYTLLQRRLLIAFALLLAGLAVLYWMERKVLSQQEQNLHSGAKWHLSIVVLLLFFIEAWGFTLQLYSLMYDTRHQPLFYGPGFVEMWFIMPMIVLSLVLLLGVAFSLTYLINTRKGIKTFIVFTAALAIILGVRYSTFVPNAIEKLIVKPNEISKERTFIRDSIRSTLEAYKLDEVEVRDFNPEPMPKDYGGVNIQTILRNIPVWDGELLETVYEQLQQLRTYYVFPSVNVGRYTVNDSYQQVFLAGRELNYSQLPAGARNWINEHLSYTHGYGPVMTPAAQGGEEPMTWFLQGIPPASDYGFKVKQPGIYYGLQSYNYVIAPNSAGEIDYPKGNDNVMTSYKGGGGVPVSSFFRKLLFAFYFKEKNLFFTTKTIPESKVLFRRNIIKRINTLTPFLLLDRTPYLVVTSDKLYWIQDAYTTSDWYPNSQTYQTSKGPVNYIRNSVKIVVDAYDGSVDYYIWDTKDPIIEAYQRIYPGLFKPMDKMPAALKPHVRYPRDMFNIQMTIYAKYHQTDPEVFYQQEDIWEFANNFSTIEEAGRIKPYYLTLDLIQPGRLDFMLVVPMLPKGRHNLRALPIVGCDPPNYGKIIIYNFPKGKLVYGPRQVYALIDQDTKIAQQFTLWNQIGSEVGRGRMILLPLGRVMLYIQPIYLKSTTAVKIPQLQRLIVSEGQNVVMEPSLEEAYAKLLERMKEEANRIQKRFAPQQSSTPGASPQAEPLSTSTQP